MKKLFKINKEREMCIGKSTIIYCKNYLYKIVLISNKISNY